MPAAVAEPVQLAQVPAPRRQAVITAVQEELAKRGYDPGRPDGHLGARTRTTIRAYQRDAGLAVDGLASKELLDHLKFAQQQPRVPSGRSPVADARSATPPPRAGRNELVLAVQRELQVRGYYEGALDGSMGPGTRTAVRAFQRDAGFPVTGDVDERLLAELRVVDANIRAGRRP